MKHAIFSGISRLHSLLKPAPRRSGLRVLTYHSIAGKLPEDPYGTSIDAPVFTAHMERLASRRAEWEFSLIDAPISGKSQLALTFDDGYKDTLLLAAPVLEALNLPMTVFVATAHLRKKSELYLTEEELKALAAKRGVAIGAHGDTHVPLDCLSDAALKEDLSRSRQILENLLGRSVRALSYPYGRVDRRVRDAALEAGYTVGACSRYGLNAAGRDPLLLCRTEITAWDSVEDLGLKVDGHWDWFGWRHRDPQDF